MGRRGPRWRSAANQSSPLLPGPMALADNFADQSVLWVRVPDQAEFVGLKTFKILCGCRAQSFRVLHVPAYVPHKVVAMHGSIYSGLLCRARRLQYDAPLCAPEHGIRAGCDRAVWCSLGWAQFWAHSRNSQVGGDRRGGGTPMKGKGLCGAPGRIRTYGLLLRRQTLYPD